jgi:hypothetical protein
MTPPPAAGAMQRGSSAGRSRSKKAKSARERVAAKQAKAQKEDLARAIKDNYHGSDSRPSEQSTDGGAGLETVGADETVGGVGGGGSKRKEVVVSTRLSRQQVWPLPTRPLRITTYASMQHQLCNTTHTCTTYMHYIHALHTLMTCSHDPLVHNGSFFQIQSRARGTRITRAVGISLRIAGHSAVLHAVSGSVSAVSDTRAAQQTVPLTDQDDVRDALRSTASVPEGVGGENPFEIHPGLRSLMHPQRPTGECEECTGECECAGGGALCTGGHTRGHLKLSSE